MQSDVPEYQRIAVPPLPKRGDPVSLEDVERALERLAAKGKAVVLRSVYAEVGRGSLSTIQKHLTTLREKNSPQAATPAVSPQLIEALASEVGRIADEKTSSLKLALDDERTALRQIVDEAEMLRESAVEAAASLEAFKLSLAERVGEASALRSQLESALRSETSYRTELEELRTQVSTAEALRSKAESDCGRLREDAEKTRLEVLRLSQVFEEERRENAVLHARLTAAAATEDALRRSSERVEELRVDLGNAHTRFSVSEAERLELGVRLEKALQAFSASESALQIVLAKLLASQASSPELGDFGAPPQHE